jgi:hypothetical protein
MGGIVNPRITTAVVMGLIALFANSSNAQTGPVSRQPPPNAPMATVVAIKGNLITISDAQGKKKTFEVASAKGLTVGTKVGWCEDDCRTLTMLDRSIPVTRVLPSSP